MGGFCPKKNLCISVKSVGQNFHRISRMNRRQACLSDYSRICADIWPLANGSRPICAAIVFGHADFADDADFFHHRMTRNLFGDFLLRRLLTEFRRGDLSGRCRYPLGSDKAIHQRFHKKSVYICEICGTKKTI